MALKTIDAYLRVGHLTPPQVSYKDTQALSSAKAKLGQISISSDAFGMVRVFRYARLIQAGGMAEGELADRVAIVTGTVDAPAGAINDTTHLTDATNFTAGDEDGK